MINLPDFMNHIENIGYALCAVIAIVFWLSVKIH